MTAIQQDIQASYVRITRKAICLAGGRGDIIQRIAIQAGYRQPEDEEKMLAKLGTDPAQRAEHQALVVEPSDEPVLAAVMWLMAEGWSDDKVLDKISEDLGLVQVGDQLREAMDSLATGASVVGLVVDYRGWSMQLLAVNVEEDDAYGPHKWQATTTADPVDDGPCDCVGRGMTPMEALDRCANEADDVESVEEDDGEDEEEEDEEDDGEDADGADASNVFNIVEEEDGP